MTSGVHRDPSVQVGEGRGRQLFDRVMGDNEEGKGVYCTPCTLYIMYTVDLPLYTVQSTKKVKRVLKTILGVLKNDKVKFFSSSFQRIGPWPILS